MKDYIPHIILSVVIFSVIIKFSSLPKTKVKITYCHIDSTYLEPIYEMIPALNYTNRTDCGMIFISNKKYEIGDSIQIKTLLY